MWGTGAGAGDLIDTVIDGDRITGFIDSYRTGSFLGKRIYSPREIRIMEYDAIIVAVQDSSEIYQQCMDLNLRLESIVFAYRGIVKKNLNENQNLLARLLGSDYAEFATCRPHIIDGPESERKTERKSILLENSTQDGMYRTDYVRIKTLEFLRDEIESNCIVGDVAELGVYRGDFSKYINAAFPNRRLYLFDTFEGFMQETVEQERKNGLTLFNKAKEQTFLSTTEEIVLEKLPHKENAIVKKGLFPKSLDGLESSFSFVSIDVDLYEPTLAGLSYFYPRLIKGGVYHDS